MRKDYYELLDIGKDSSMDQIKDQFRKLALKHHPDVKQSEPLDDKFLLIKEAYETLSNSDQKRRYDDFIGNLIAFQEQKQTSSQSEQYGEYIPKSQEQMEKDYHFERIRMEIQRNIDIERAKKAELLRKKEEEDLILQQQKEQLREQQRKQTQQMWEQVKDFEKVQQQLREQQAAKTNIHKRVHNANFEDKLQQIENQEKLYEENRRKYEDLYMKDYQNRIKSSERQKKEFEKMRKWGKLQAEIEKDSGKVEEIYKPAQPISNIVQGSGGYQVKDAELLQFDQTSVQKAIQSNQIANNEAGQKLLSGNSMIVVFLLGISLVAISRLFANNNKDTQPTYDKANTFIERPKYNSSSAKPAEQPVIKKTPNQYEPQIEEEDPDKMFTVVLIPTEPAPADPKWMIKIKAGKKLDPIEIEEYYRDQFDKDHKKLFGERFSGVPNAEKLKDIAKQYHSLKKDCIISQNQCSLRYNQEVFTGPGNECGHVDIFKIWIENTNEKEARKSVLQMMDQYEFPIFSDISRSRKGLNAFFQAKYGLFTCYDSVHNMGYVDYDPDFLLRWERQKKSLKFTWYWAMLYAINSEKITPEDLKNYRKSFKEGKKFQHYLKSHPTHEDDARHLIIDVKCADMFQRIDETYHDANKKKLHENLFRKVKFYQKNKNYLIPNHIKAYIDIEDDEELSQKIYEKVQKMSSAEAAKLEKRRNQEKRVLPHFILNPDPIGRIQNPVKIDKGGNATLV